MTKKKILVVDDEAPITRFLKIALERAGTYEIQTENHGSLALKAAAAFRPDLILLDINLEDENGGEISERFQKNLELKEIPIVFLTGAVSPSEVDSGMATISGRDVVAKPVNMEKLVQTIEKNLKT